MTKSEILSQYSQVSMQMGDLLFKLEALEADAAAVKAKMAAIRSRKAELEKAIQAFPPEAPATKEASDAVETEAV